MRLAARGGGLRPAASARLPALSRFTLHACRHSHNPPTSAHSAILFIDDIHTITGPNAQQGGGVMDASVMLKPLLSRRARGARFSCFPHRRSVLLARCPPAARPLLACSTTPFIHLSPPGPRCAAWAAPAWTSTASSLRRTPAWSAASSRRAGRRGFVCGCVGGAGGAEGRKFIEKDPGSGAPLPAGAHSQRAQGGGVLGSPPASCPPPPAARARLPRMRALLTPLHPPLPAPQVPVEPPSVAETVSILRGLRHK